MRTLFVAACVFVVGALVLAGCMGPEVQWVPADLEIFDAKVSAVTTHAATVTWRTNTESLSRVVVMNQQSVSNTLLDTNLTLLHSMQLTGLTSATYYLLMVQGSNMRGASAFETGVTLAFQTLP